MQQNIVRRDVYEPDLIATVDGRVLETIEGETERALPDPFDRDELRAATGRVTVLEGPDSVSRVVTPWDPGTEWPPVPQRPATMSVDTGAGPVPVMGDALVTAAEGDQDGREVYIELADKYESLNKTISWEQVPAVIPSLEEADFGRYVGMTSTSITDHILRECGWETTPKGTNYVMLDVPAQGSMWPRRGIVTESNRMNEGGFPYWWSSDWGVAAADVDATYTLLGGGYSLAGRGGVELTAMTQLSSSSSAGTMYLDVQVGDPYGASIRLSWTDNNVFVRLRNSTGSYFTAVSVPRVDGLAYATVEYLSSTSVYVTLRSGQNSASETVTVHSSLTSGAMRVARIWGQGRAGGFLVQAPNRLGELEGWEPNAVIYARQSNRNALTVREPAEGESCANLLASQCEAEAATYWIDETGVLRWWDLARLEAESSVATLTSDHDIEESGFTWRHDRSKVRSRVSVRWTQIVQHRSWRTNVDFHQGRGQTLQPGEVVEDLLPVPDDELWIMPDLSLERVGTHDMDGFNYGIGSWYGGIVSDTDTDRWAYGSGYPGTGSFLMTIERITDRLFKTWLQWTGSETITLRTPQGSESPTLWRSRRSFDLPIIRGKLKFSLAEQITYSAQDGPDTAPEHEIDARRWIQDPEQARYTADYAGGRLTVPQPELSSVGLIPMPGLQLGDVVTIEDTHDTMLTIRGIVVRDERDYPENLAMTHTIRVRPTYVTRNGVTWAQWADVMDGRTWNTWGTEQNPGTWAQWGQTPLLGEDTVNG